MNLRPLFASLVLALPALTAQADPAVVGSLQINNEAELAKCVAKEAKVEKVAGSMKFLEGPQWVGGATGFLIFSDIPANEVKK